MHEYELKCREHYLGLKTHDVNPPKHLWKLKRIRKASDLYLEAQRELIGEVLRAPEGSPIKACKNPLSLELQDFEGKYRGGRKRDNWWIEGVKQYWKHITNTKYTYYKDTALCWDTSKPEGKVHQVILETAAECRIGLKQECENILTTKTKISLGWIKSKWSEKRGTHALSA